MRIELDGVVSDDDDDKPSSQLERAKIQPVAKISDVASGSEVGAEEKL